MFLPEADSEGSHDIAAEFELAGSDAEGWSVLVPDRVVFGPSGLGDALNEVLIRAHGALAADTQKGHSALHAAALVVGDHGLLMPGASRGGKSTLVSRMLGLGFGYLTDDVCLVSRSGDVSAPFRPLTVRADTWAEMQVRGNTRPSLTLGDGARLVAVPQPAVASARVGLIIFPRFVSGARLSLELVSSAKAAMLLMQHNYSVHDKESLGLETISQLAGQVPALVLTYGKSEQIGGPVQKLIERAMAGLSREEIGADLPRVAEQVLQVTNALATTPKPLPAPTPRKGPVRLTIGMATYDDYDGVYFTIQAMRLYHPEVLEDTEFVVVDNHPEGVAAPHLKGLEHAIGNYRYIPFTDTGGTAAPRDRIVAEADGRYVLSLDCHVMLVPGAVRRLLAHFSANPETSDLLQGPLLYDDARSISPYWKPSWGSGMYGQWASDPRADDMDAPPFDIEMQGLGLYAFRRDAWPGFHPKFRGFGGEEFYIHEKFRHRGDRTLCLPFLRWMHRFGRPGGVPYRNKWEDRIRNYLLGHAEFGIQTETMEAHFRQLLGAETATRLFREARAELGLEGPAPEA